MESSEILASVDDTDEIDLGQLIQTIQDEELPEKERKAARSLFRKKMVEGEFPFPRYCRKCAWGYISSLSLACIFLVIFYGLRFDLVNQFKATPLVLVNSCNTTRPALTVSVDQVASYSLSVFFCFGDWAPHKQSVKLIVYKKKLFFWPQKFSSVMSHRKEENSVAVFAVFITVPKYFSFMGSCNSFQFSF